MIKFNLNVDEKSDREDGVNFNGYEELIEVVWFEFFFLGIVFIELVCFKGWYIWFDVVCVEGY